MCHLHQRGAQEFQDVVMQDVLDRLPLEVYRRVGFEFTEGTQRSPMEMSWVQPPTRESPEALQLLVSEGARSKVDSRHASILMWSNMWEKKSRPQILPASVPGNLPRWSLSSVRPNGSDSVMLLRKRNQNSKVPQHRLRERVQLRPSMWRADALR